MCVKCIKTQFDITKDIEREVILNFCRECERYLSPPQYWSACPLESKELLQICLKKIHGLKKVTLVDANFVWTEPHSKRLKVKVIVQKEMFSGIKLQQSALVTYVVDNLQCPQCKKFYTNQDWAALVQVRQKTIRHKKTFLYVEQLILKHEMHQNCSRIRERPDGLDFYYQHINLARKMADFVAQYCPTRVKLGKRLVSVDFQSNIYSYKKTISVEIAPICKNDLVCLPKVIRAILGGISPVVLCSHVNKGIFFIDPFTLATKMLTAQRFWEHPFRSFLNSRQLVKYVVLDVELIRTPSQHGKSKKTKSKKGHQDMFEGMKHHKKFRMCEVTISRFDDMDEEKYVKSHLGHLLKIGDTVLCYDLDSCNYNDDNVDKLPEEDVPEVVIVKKFYRKRLNYGLKRRLDIVKETVTGKGKKDPEKELRELEAELVNEVLEDDDLKKNVDLVKTGEDKDDDDDDDDDDEEEEEEDEGEKKKKKKEEKKKSEKTVEQ